MIEFLCRKGVRQAPSGVRAACAQDLVGAGERVPQSVSPTLPPTPHVFWTHATLHTKQEGYRAEAGKICARPTPGGSTLEWAAEGSRGQPSGVRSAGSSLGARVCVQDERLEAG